MGADMAGRGLDMNKARTVAKVVKRGGRGAGAEGNICGSRNTLAYPYGIASCYYIAK